MAKDILTIAAKAPLSLMGDAAGLAVLAGIAWAVLHLPALF
ncbi:MAG: hypothetical protein ACU0BF_12485 [Paracoccaceae bacterium]